MKALPGLAAMLVVVMALAAGATAAVQSSAPPAHKERSKMLVHLTQGPENPTRAALAFLVAKTAIDEGDVVTLCLAGDAVQLLRDGVLDNLSGLGTGMTRTGHYGLRRSIRPRVSR